MPPDDTPAHQTEASAGNNTSLASGERAPPGLWLAPRPPRVNTARCHPFQLSRSVTAPRLTHAHIGRPWAVCNSIYPGAVIAPGSDRFVPVIAASVCCCHGRSAMRCPLWSGRNGERGAANETLRDRPRAPCGADRCRRHSSAGERVGRSARFALVRSLAGRSYGHGYGESSAVVCGSRSVGMLDILSILEMNVICQEEDGSRVL